MCHRAMWLSSGMDVRLRPEPLGALMAAAGYIFTLLLFLRPFDAVGPCGTCMLRLCPAAALESLAAAKGLFLPC